MKKHPVQKQLLLQAMMQIETYQMYVDILLEKTTHPDNIQQLRAMAGQYQQVWERLEAAFDAQFPEEKDSNFKELIEADPNLLNLYRELGALFFYEETLEKK